MGIGVRGIGVVGGFGAGLPALRAALAGTVPPPRLVAIPAEGGAFEASCYQADTSSLERYFDRKTLRRVDRFSRLGLLAASLAIEDAGWSMNDCGDLGLVVATGYGASGSTFAFLDSIINDGDACSSPTHFSSSVHNAAAANISILLGIKGPGLTVSQFELSFHSALLTAFAWLSEGRVGGLLCGAVDEFGDVIGYCRRRFFGPEIFSDQSTTEDHHSFNPLDLDRQGSAAGEGAAFFLLTADTAGAGLVLRDVSLGNIGHVQPPLSKHWPLIIGADGNRLCSRRYERCLAGAALAAGYAPLYGSFPAAAAVDMAVASLALRDGALQPSPGAVPPGAPWRAPQEPVPLDGGPVACLKIGAGGDWGLATLAREGSD